jgi:AraC-like DNA-binding protein
VLYIGEAGDTSPHIHHAIQICVALNGSFRLRGAPDARWESYRGAIVPSVQPHHLDGSGCEVVIVFLEPESEGGRRLAVGGLGGAFQPVPPDAIRSIRAAAATACAEEIGPQAATALCQRILECLGVRTERQGAPDERVRAALLLMRDDPARRWRAAEVAAAAGLSTRRFRDVFSSQVGMGFRQFLLWTRIGAALQQLASGASLTEASLAAGFSDAAHLTRTFRRMVGIVPSAIARSVSFMETPGREGTEAAVSFKTRDHQSR